MEDAKWTLPRGNHCNNNNKNTQEHQGGPGEEVGKQCEEYREGPVRTTVGTPNTKARLHDNPLPTALLCFARRWKHEYPPIAYKAQNLRGRGKWALKYYSLYTKGETS